MTTGTSANIRAAPYAIEEGLFGRLTAHAFKVAAATVALLIKTNALRGSAIQAAQDTASSTKWEEFSQSRSIVGQFRHCWTVTKLIAADAQVYCAMLLS
jgi:hypothetical protein